MFKLDDLFRYNYENKEAFESLKDMINRKKYDIIPFIGAGMSFPLYPLWYEFIKKSIENSIIDDRKNILLKLEQNEIDLLECTSILKYKLGKIRYYNLIKRTFDICKIDKNIVKDMPIYLLPALFENSSVATTNFDKVIEYVYDCYNKGFKDVILPIIKDESEIQKTESIRNDCHYLIKLHGDVQSIDKLIFSKEDYEKIYGNGNDTENVKYLKLLFASKSMLFLGCSLKEDRTVSLLKYLSLNNNYFPHYAIMEMRYEECDERYYQELKRISDMNINCIWYPPNEHNWIKYIMKELMKTAKTSDVKLIGKVPFFSVGRKKEVKNIRINLECYKVLLRGVGGIGKTHLVELYIKEYHANYTKIIRMNYKMNLPYTFINEMWETLPEQVKILSIKEQFSAILKILSDLCCSFKILLVIDNATDIEGAEWKQILSLPCHVLITSREHSVFKYGQGLKEMEINELGKSDCLHIFNFYYDVYNKERNVILDIVKELSYLTLLIELAAKSAKAAGLTPSELLESLKKKSLFTCINEQIYDKKEDIYKKPVDIILNLFSLAELEKSEVLFLSFFSTLPYSKYRKTIILKWTWYNNHNLINKLITKGWIQDNDLTISMHPIVAETITLQTKPTFNKLRKYLFTIIKWVENDEVPKEIMTNLPNIVLWFINMCKVSKKNVKCLYLASRLLHLCAKYYLFIEGITLYNCVSEIYDLDDLYIRIYEYMSELYISMGNYSQALDFIEQSKNAKKSIFGEFSKEMIGVYIKEAIIYRNLGKYQLAILDYRKALEIECHVPNENSENLIIIYTYLSRALLELNLIPDALNCCNKALNIIKDKKEDLTSATVYNRYGFILAVSGKYNDSEQNLIKAQEIRKKLLGELNPDTASVINNLGFLYYLWGRYEDAQKYFDIALNIRLKILGDMHSGTATTYNNLGRVFLKMEDYKSAIHYFLIALKIRKRVFGRENENTLYVYYNIGNVYEIQKLFDKALFLYRYIYNIRKKLLGKNHVETARVCKDIKRLLSESFNELS